MSLSDRRAGRLLLAAFLLALVVLAHANSGADGATANLIANGNAETPPNSGANYADVDVAGFETETGAFTIVRYGSGNFPSLEASTKIAGGTAFFAGGAAAVSTGEQRLDVSGSASRIDSGSGAYTLSASIGGYANQKDNAKVEAFFLGVGDAALGRAVIGPVSETERANATTLLPRSSSGVMPAGTRAVRIVATMTRVSGTSNDGYLDNVSFALSGASEAPKYVAAGPARTITPPPPTSAMTIVRFGAPVSITGGGQMLTVTASRPCKLSAKTQLRVGNQWLDRLEIPGAIVSVPPTSAVTLVPGRPVQIPIRAVTTRVPTPGAPAVVNPPPVPTVTTVSCVPVVGIFAGVVGFATPARVGRPVARPPVVTTTPAVPINPPPAPTVAAAPPLTTGLWSGVVTERIAGAPQGRVSFEITPDGEIRDFRAFGVAETCYAPAGQLQNGSVTSTPYFVGVTITALAVTGQAYQKTAPFNVAPGGGYVRFVSPGLRFDGARSAYATMEAYRKATATGPGGVTGTCELRFSFSAAPGGSAATPRSGFVYRH